MIYLEIRYRNGLTHTVREGRLVDAVEPRPIELIKVRHDNALDYLPPALAGNIVVAVELDYILAFQNACEIRGLEYPFPFYMDLDLANGEWQAFVENANPVSGEGMGLEPEPPELSRAEEDRVLATGAGSVDVQIANL